MSISLVTGATGFRVAHVTNHLIKSGHKVIVIDDLSGGFVKNINKKAIFVKCTILYKATVLEKLKSMKNCLQFGNLNKLCLSI